MFLVNSLDGSGWHVLKNEVGKTYERLTVESFCEVRKVGNGTRLAFWNCLCSCGKQVVVSGAHLRSGNTKSCGCWHRDRVRETGQRNKGRNAKRNALGRFVRNQRNKEEVKNEFVET